ncbi:MAG: GreA/GreB family elongation factor [Caldilineaceae bacterium]
MMITRDGYERLQGQLEELRTVKRPAALRDLQEVSGSADWRENAQLIQMQNALGHVDAEIHRLEMTLARCQIVEPQSDDAKVDVGETVVLQTNGEVETYTIVSPAESDPDRGRISYESPLGRALLKQNVGDEIDVKAPAGLLHYRIVAVQ